MNKIVWKCERLLFQADENFWNCVGLGDEMTVGKRTFLYACSVYRKADQFDWPVQNGIMNYDI
jgi:hypothetical protein